MASSTSRYAQTETVTWTAPDGTTVRYLKRRFIADASTMPLRQEVTVLPLDRPDLVSARTLGDPLQWWRIADANTAVDPLALTAVAGARLRVPVPQFPHDPS
jgi:hypothetical protein